MPSNQGLRDLFAISHAKGGSVHINSSFEALVCCKYLGRSSATKRMAIRSQLIARVELRLEKNCFGISAWEDTFYRDMRFVKQAFQAAGYQLLYSRNKQQPGYYLHGQPVII